MPALLIGATTDSALLSAAERAKAENDARSAVAQLLGGLAVAAGLLFTAAQVQQQRAEQSAKLLLQSVEKLTSATTETYLYAINALDRVADLSRDDRTAADRILTEIIRRRLAEWNGNRPRSDRQVKGAALYRADAVFQAAVEALGRARRFPRKEPLQLESMWMSQPHLDGLAFEWCCLRNANFGDGHFNGTSFRGSSLHNGSLSGEFNGADFRGCDLRGAKIVAHGPLRNVRFKGAFYNNLTDIKPEELFANLRREGRFEEDAGYPLIPRCR